MDKALEKKLKNLPRKPGIYFLKGARGKILYIGKAANLKNRVSSYFVSNYKTFNAAKLHLVVDIKDIAIQETPTEIEALILESELIKKKQPPFNVRLRDDKKYFYVGITRDPLPIIFLTHQKDQPKKRGAEYIGPFTDGVALKRTLKMLRRIFPYYSVRHDKRKRCTYCHIGLCPGPDPKISHYKKTIRNLKDILRGKRTTLLRKLEKEMKATSSKKQFEKAGDLRDQITSLSNIFEHSITLGEDRNYDRNYAEGAPGGMSNYVVQKTLKKIGIPINPKANLRIEGYDISNIQGVYATGSMVVFERNLEGNILPNKNEYRKFRIKTVRGANDVAMIREILKRRLKRRGWRLPALILIDGGRGQLNAAQSEIDSSGLDIPLISLAKREEEIYIPGKKTSVRLPKSSPLLRLLMHIRDESHRFAIGYYRSLHQKEYKK